MSVLLALIAGTPRVRAWVKLGFRMRRHALEALIGLIGIAVINILLQLFYRPPIDALIPAIHEVPAFLKTAKAIGALSTNLFPTERETLANGVAQSGLLRRATSWLKFEPSQEASEILGSLYTYASFLLVLDMTAFVFTINSVKRLQPTLQRMFDAIGYIDATQSIAAWRKTLPHWTAPEFTSANKAVRVTGLVHPLVNNAIANNVTISNDSALITGSNMSGKTTFIRALGVNAILAQLLGTVVATGWRAVAAQRDCVVGADEISRRDCRPRAKRAPLIFGMLHLVVLSFCNPHHLSRSVMHLSRIGKSSAIAVAALFRCRHP